jgi:hypothetical protein
MKIQRASRADPIFTRSMETTRLTGRIRPALAKISFVTGSREKSPRLTLTVASSTSQPEATTSAILQAEVEAAMAAAHCLQAEAVGVVHPRLRAQRENPARSSPLALCPG